MPRRCWFVALALGWVLLWAGAVAAHRPAAIGGTFGTPETAVSIHAPDVSQVVYGALAPTRPSLWIALEVVQNMDLYVELGVPALERLRAFRPQMAVLGPGLPPLPLPVAAPSGVGAVLVVTSSVTDGVFFHEPFTDTNSWKLGGASVHIPAPGTYYVVVWSSSPLDGKVWVSVGTREAFGWRDILALPRTIQAVRAFHEVGRDERLVAAARSLFLAAFAAVISLLARWA